jgi:hypothetical protein
VQSPPFAPGGHVLVETAVRQARTAAQIFEKNRLTAQIAVSEEFDVAVIAGMLEIP